MATFTYEKISNIHTVGSPPVLATIEASTKQITTNITSIYPHQGGGRSGHIVLTIGTTTAYQAQAPLNIAFIEPANPGLTPIIPVDVNTTALIGELRASFDVN